MEKLIEFLLNIKKILVTNDKMSSLLTSLQQTKAFFKDGSWFQFRV